MTEIGMNNDNFLLNDLSACGKYCTGCAACYNACSANALSMEPNSLGFLEPHINNEICIACNECREACPLLTPLHTKYESAKTCYAGQAATAVRKESSSGGVFFLLAEKILQQNGVVFGAAMDSNLIVHHIKAQNIDELKLLRKSKYVQSEIGETYRAVKSCLKQDQKVLFSGTPCQVAGLKKYLEGFSTDQLFTQTSHTNKVC